MATTVAGFADPNVILESSWARMWGGSPIREQVQGFDAAPGPTARTVTLSPGTAWLSGVLADTDTPATVTIAANTSGQTRHDLIVIAARWATRTVAPEVVAGSPGSGPPNATRNPGVVWQGEVAVVTVPSGFDEVFSPADIKTVALRPVAPVYSIETVSGPLDPTLPPVEWRAVVHAKNSGRMYVSNGQAYSEMTMPDHTHPYQKAVLYGTGNPPTSGVSDGDLYIKYV
jgi:hypothetical protein